jgi:hypothetical protein
MISRSCAAAGGSDWTSQSTIPGAPLLDPAAARQLRPHDRSDSRDLAQLPEPRDTPTEVGYAVAEVVQLVEQHGAGPNARSRTLFLALDRRDRATRTSAGTLPAYVRLEQVQRAAFPVGEDLPSSAR